MAEEFEADGTRIHAHTYGITQEKAVTPYQPNPAHINCAAELTTTRG